MASLAIKAEIFRRRIIEWYRLFGDRNLPWRATDNSWAVLVAAFMLRKTTTKQVLKVYEEFIKKYPTPQSLMKADVRELEELIRPLGIERKRARHLVELAKYIVKKFGGAIPCLREKLLELPSVGDYIASEVLLATCHQPEPLLDRNMIRVLERVFGVRSSKPRPHTDPVLWSFARLLVPKDPLEARDFNYGVLDFARKVCRARSPLCGECPLTDICCYFSNYRKMRCIY
ncbi:MAG: A/G-specific adenine glycosylase [Pyrobaculum sp.]